MYATHRVSALNDNICDVVPPGDPPGRNRTPVGRRIRIYITTGDMVEDKLLQYKYIIRC